MARTLTRTVDFDMDIEPPRFTGWDLERDADADAHLTMPPLRTRAPGALSRAISRDRRTWTFEHHWAAPRPRTAAPWVASCAIALPVNGPQSTVIRAPL